ncbi:talin isoform X1 [Bombus pascuorum]|uniref:talin isoform X1 n=1 Tax=Bombus pascuorum TaxID=65598 RepID=UPI00212BFC94|nr:talin isoform X1 [Bombus pascuorum]XP_060823358.1 talin isoform X1 [Bombus pascuorum]XP_060823359.1 talin isoform X1 [Bombus pascuorum]XP_060823360.1 talin isoform X1 [Bombus pascuorum]XP_060823362.1 talin isoform X1 [Bombus pascuorum]
MATLSLRISIPEKNATKMMQFDPSTSIYDACRIIREKLAEAGNMGQPKDYGLFLADEDVKKGVWLEPGRNLDYYILRNGDLLEYRRKLRTLRVRMLDGTLKTLLVDDSQPVANLMVVICTKIGITNHDEYSLVRELADEETENQKPGNFGTLTLKRRKEEKGERDAKMDQLRKKLKTDDEVNWIDPSKTLREQGIDESETVLLRRKFFFSDQNIDSRDPVQLSLLYVQARDAILDGTHPVTQEKACIFAGIQCQIQFGDHKEDKHKPGFLDLKEFLPQSYLKVKGIEKKIFAEHKKHIGLSELDAKVLYTKTARSLSTYGVTFFLVKEKMKGKNKLVPRLLGVTKDSVLRLDEKTKEILKTWPLTTVRRWGASPNTFTLDFGDYSDQYYSVQTTEAEQILQLISGYIDIILKKQKAKDHFGIEGDEGSTMVEDSVSPLKATIMQHETSNVGKGNVEAVSVAIPAVMRTGADGARPYGTGHMGGAQYTTVSGQVNIAHAPPMVQQTKVTSVLSEPQRALLSTITAGHEVIHIAETELSCKAQLPELGNDPASLKWIEQTIDTHKQNVGSQIAAMNAATAQVVTLTSGPADDVDHTAVGAAITTIATNLPEMTKGVRMIAALMDDDSSGDKLLDAARKLCSAFSDLLKATEPETKEPSYVALSSSERYPRQNLLNAASRVGEASHQVLTTIGEENDSNRELQDMLLALAKAVANSTAALVLKAKNIAATCEDSATQNRVISAATQCALATSQLVACAKVVAPTLHSPACQTQLMNAVREVTKAVEGLLEVCNETCSDETLLKELNAAATEVKTRAREACGGLELDAAEELINSLKDELREFYNAVEAASLRPLPDETPESTALRLGATSKNVGFAMAQLLSAAKQGNENYTGSAARKTASALKDLTYAVRGVAATSHQPDTQKKILMTADDVILKSLRLVKEARRALKNADSVENEANLAAVAKDVSNALNKCVSCLPGQRDVDDAIKNIEDMTQVLGMNEFPQTNKSYGQLQSDLNNAAANLNDASSNVVSSVRSPVQLANSSKQFTNAFGDLLGVGMEMAGQTAIETRSQMVVSLKNVSMTSSKLLGTAKSVAADPGAPNAKNQLSAAARAVTDSINYLVDVCTSAAPGQNECDNAIRNIQSMRSLLDNPSQPISDASYFECLETVMEKSKSLGDGMTGIANHAKKSEHEQFSVAVRGVSLSICGLIEAAAQAAYLAGVSDPTSVAGKPGLLDQAQFLRAAQAIHTGCQSLGNPTSTEQQVLSAATMIAKYTSALCNACREASNKTSNPVAKRHFVQSAKDVANSTSVLVKEIKALDQNYSEANKAKCAEATRPLLEAVDNLCTFAGSPEFASQPAKISVTARAAQEPITSAGKAIIDGSCAMVRAAKSLAVSPKDPPTWQLLANHSKSVSDSIKSLVASIRDKAPGQKECDVAIEKLSARIRELNAASFSAVSQALVSRRENTMQGFTDQMETSASELREKLEPLRTAAKYEAENVGHAVNQIALYCEPLVSGAIGAASNMVHSKQQIVLLDQTKTVTESALQLVCVTKESGGNPKAVNLHTEVDETVESMKDALQELQNTLETISTSYGIVTGLIDAISRAMVRLEDHRMSTIDTVDSYVDYQTRMVEAAKEIARLAQEMSTKSSTDVARLSPLIVDISHKYTQLARDTSGASAAASNADVSARLRASVQELGKACVDIVRAAGTCQMSPGDAYTQREVAEHSKIVTEKVSQVLAALQAGSRGTQACINAASTVSGIIGDLDTTIMFATAGTLHAENEGDTFADHRENILKTAKALVEDTKTLVAGAASSQEQLAVAAQNAVSTIVQLAEVVKYGAASLGSQNPEAQVMLINAVKDVASALGDLIHATKAASGKPINDPSMAHLKDSAKVMVTNVTSLLKTVKAVEDEHTRGTRALESTIEAIAQEIRALNTPETQKINVTPEDLVRCTKSITTSTAKAVAAGNSCKQDDIIVAANMGRKAISDMLTICKGAAYNCAETAELRERTLQAGHDVALNYRELLQAILQISSRSGDAKHTLPPISRKIAQSVTELVAVAELLKGTDWVDPDDPTVIAENELLGAAASIDAAAKKLASLRPRRSIQEANEDMNFDEMILEAAKSIAAATSALIKAASAAQRELIATGKVSRTPLTSSDDGQWSEGLISAARMVAAATHSLVESANALVQGVSSEEKLISSAKQVASSTAQLLVACKVKADPDSESTKRLQAAGNAVKRATDNLVRAAQQAIQQEEDRSLILNRRMVGGIAQEINARSEVLRIERELEEARGRLTAIRQAKYKNRPDLADTDTDAEQSGYESTTRYETRAYETHNQSQMNYSTYQQHSTTHNIGQLGSDRQTLVSPEKVYSTQSTLERKMKESQYRSTMESQYGSVEKKYNESQYDRRYVSDSPYLVTEKKVTMESSSGQYSSIERKINKESYNTEATML